MAGEEIKQSEIHTRHTLSLVETELESIEEKMVRYARSIGAEWGFHDEDYDRGAAHLSETTYMIPGTLALIPQILEAQKGENPYDVLVFLDKSARPAAYLYWRILNKMRDRGLLDTGIKLPEIKFIDIGKTNPKWKRTIGTTPENMRAAITSKEMLPRGDQSRVLIVDEFKETGSTLTMAEEAFINAYGVVPEGTYQFLMVKQHAPFWYNSLRKNLVLDADITKHALEAIEDPQTKELLSYLVNNLSRNEFISMLKKKMADQEKGVTSTAEGLLSATNSLSRTHDFNPEEMAWYLDRLANLAIKAEPKSLYETIRSNVGVNAVPKMGAQDRAGGIETRKLLDCLAESVVEKLLAQDNQ